MTIEVFDFTVDASVAVGVVDSYLKEFAFIDHLINLNSKPIETKSPNQSNNQLPKVSTS
ncbi:unnamed protein product [Lupinus luteus]|uniref:Uncharacterized protein n=1 Tax=Lupinus luteus TaxID=3873 RepID=A0AAV1XXP2_LUPLU